MSIAAYWKRLAAVDEGNRRGSRQPASALRLLGYKSRMATEQKQRIGFIGLGAMGSRMAERLRTAGYPLVVYNRSPGPTGPFRAAGVPVAATPAELAGRCDVILSMLFNDEAVRSVMTGPGGVLSAAAPGSTVIDVSTVSPNTSQDLHEAASRRGVLFLDAPVSGSTPQAEQGQLVFVVGGDLETFEKHRPLLLTMGKAAERLGGPGAGATAKLAINAMLAIGVQALGEGLALAERGGLDRKQFLDVIGQTAVVSPGQKAKFANAEKDQFPPAFALRTVAKDLGLILALAEQLKLNLPATAATRAAADRAVGEHGDDDFSVLIRTAREG
jgi:3-hydroxyisobutyrate dehydrogenase-like beta-hydroxyacid dehydrogenase